MELYGCTTTSLWLYRGRNGQEGKNAVHYRGNVLSYIRVLWNGRDFTRAVEACSAAVVPLDTGPLDSSAVLPALTQQERTSL